ncbi:MAG: RyR domain-containing protein [Bryobacteraceae bacterium]
MEPYRPQPIDTSGADLGELQPRLEELARNAHEGWARERMNAGWGWGAARSDTEKHHPSLVAYEDLPESEKDYDRAVVAETLKTVIALGYRISRG